MLCPTVGSNPQQSEYQADMHLTELGSDVSIMSAYQRHMCLELSIYFSPIRETLEVVNRELVSPPPKEDGILI